MSTLHIQFSYTPLKKYNIRAQAAAEGNAAFVMAGPDSDIGSACRVVIKGIQQEVTDCMIL